MPVPWHPGVQRWNGLGQGDSAEWVVVREDWVAVGYGVGVPGFSFCPQLATDTVAGFLAPTWEVSASGPAWSQPSLRLKTNEQQFIMTETAKL